MKSLGADGSDGTDHGACFVTLRCFILFQINDVSGPFSPWQDTVRRPLGATHQSTGTVTPL